MKNLCKEIAQSFLISINRCKRIYILCAFFVAAGIVLGLILSFSSARIGDFLSVSDKNYMAYLKGGAELSVLFLDKFSHILIASIICIVMSLNGITIVFSLGYLMYQSIIMVMTSAAVISTFGFVGVINSLVLIMPFNIILIVSLAFQIATMFTFCSFNKSLGKFMFDCALDKLWWTRLLIMTFFQLIVCSILSFVVPFLLKSLIIVSF